MRDSLSEKIEYLIERESGALERIEKINQALIDSNPDEQHMLGSALSTEALEEIYKIKENLTISKSVEEHLLYSYYLNTSKTSVSNGVIKRLIEDYSSKMFISLVSIVVGWIKKERLSMEQIEVIKQNFKDQEVEKQLLKLSVKNDLKNGKNLSSKDITELLDKKFFDVLESALDFNLVEVEALDKFSSPLKGEKDKKHRKMLYEKAQSIIKA